MNEQVMVVALLAFVLALSALTGKPYIREVLTFFREHGRTIAIVVVFLAFLSFLSFQNI